MEQFDERQGLAVITEMISVAKKSFVRMSFYFLLWGWLLVAAALSEYVLKNVVEWQWFWIGWPAVGVIGGIVSALRGARHDSKSGATTYMDRMFMLLWLGFVATLVILIVSLVFNKVSPGPAVTVLTGLPTFVSGGVMRFKPLMIGGVLFWAFGLASFFVPGEYSAIIFSVAIVCGYLIPGYLLQNAERNGRV